MELTRFPMLRQQEVIADDKPNRSLADFVAPLASGVADYIGAFAVTAGIGAEALAARYEAAHDDYSAIIVKALADRLAEAFAEYLHAQARRDWGYGADEQLVAGRAGRRGVSAASARPSAIRPVRTTPRSGGCSTCSTPRRSAWASPSRSP